MTWTNDMIDANPDLYAEIQAGLQEDLPFETDEEAADRELRERFARRHWLRHNKPSASARRRERLQRMEWEYELEAQADRAAMMHEYHPLTGRDDDDIYGRDWAEEAYNADPRNFVGDDYDPHAYANDLFDVQREEMARELGLTQEI